MPYTFSTTLQVQLSDGSFQNLESEMLSYTTSLDVGIFTMGIASATFTMRNFTNAFTPNAGGTYSNVNWFGSKFLLLLTLSDGTTTYTAYLFEGICTDFTIDSASADSIVTFSCIDPFTYTGPTQTDYSVSTASLETAAYFIDNLVDKIKFPLLNYASASGAFNSIGVNDGTGTIYAGSSTKGGVSDIISSQLLPSSASISWPYYSSLNFIMTDITYNSAVIYLTPQKDKYEVNGPYYVYGSDIAPVAGSLVFNTLQAAYVRSDFATSAQINSSSASPIVVSNSADSSVYGTKTISWPSLLTPSPETSEYQAYALVNRFDTLGYVPTNVEMRLSQIKSLDTTSQVQFVSMLDMLTGMWERMELKYTPVGSNVAVMSQNIITGRTISGTPADVFVSFRTKPYYNWNAFELDDSFNGVLGGGTLTYDQAEIMYDESEWTYNDSFVEQGSRLGW